MPAERDLQIYNHDQNFSVRILIKFDVQESVVSITPGNVDTLDLTEEIYKIQVLYNTKDPVEFHDMNIVGQDYYYPNDQTQTVEAHDGLRSSPKMLIIENKGGTEITSVYIVYENELTLDISANGKDTHKIESHIRYMEINEQEMERIGINTFKYGNVGDSICIVATETGGN